MMFYIKRLTALALVAFSISASALEPASFEQALNFYNHTDYKAAIRSLQGLPQTSRNLELLGRCYLMDADYKKATEVLEKAVALDPRNSMTLTWLGRAEGRRAETSMALGGISHANKAREAFEKAVQVNPSNKEALDDLFDYYIQAPGFVGGGFDKAHQLLPLIAKLDPAEAYFAQGRMAEEKKDFDTAEAQFRRTVELAPNSVGRMLDLARFLAKRNRLDDSERILQQAAHLAPNAPRVLFARAEIWIQSNRNVPQARAILQKYITLNNLTPDDPQRAEALALLKKTGGI
jgi:tetratricopeptide (TPR) repeat protein